MNCKNAGEHAWFRQRELIDISLHFANGELGGVSMVFCRAYLRDRPKVLKRLGLGGDERRMALEQIQKALNVFLGADDGADDVVQIRDRMG